MTCLHLALLLLASTLLPAVALAKAPSFNLTISDPEALARLESLGLDLAGQLSQTERGSQGAVLARLPAFQAVAAVLQQDIAGDQRSAATLVPAFPGVLSLFDPAWLASSATHFDLAGVVLRPDRILQRPSTCGELRLIYRLRLDAALAGSVDVSMLPATLSLQFDVPRPAGGCGDQATALRDATSGRDRQLLEGPSLLAKIVTRRVRLAGLEVNLQSSRWATDGSSTFSDQVHYVLRRFVPGPEAETLRVSTLENTPDVEHLNRSPALKRRFLAWLLAPETLIAADRGAYQMPEEFLATKAVSVSPFGAYRRANQPLSAILTPADFTGVTLARLPVSRTPGALVERLDGFTCNGCHQQHAISGFHYLGLGPPSQASYNRLQTPFSAYFAAIQAFRGSFTGRRRAAASLVMPDARRPQNAGSIGAPCAAGGPPSGGWTCDAPLVCRGVVNAASLVGECSPPNSEANGSPCNRVTIVSASDALRDHWQDDGVSRCAGVCATTSNGFPAGLCSDSCRHVGPGLVCASVPQLGPFSTCLQRGLPFAACLRSGSIAALMPACRTQADCRPDYVCAATDAASGVCAPPYFLPQLTVDHHAHPAH